MIERYKQRQKWRKWKTRLGGMERREGVQEINGEGQNGKECVFLVDKFALIADGKGSH